MAYVPGVKYDLFISYARVDDEADHADDGWVSAFVGDLSRAVKSRLGLRSNEGLEVFFDRRNLRSDDDLETLRKTARSSAVFVAVVSPSYVVRDWPQEELGAFTDDPRSAGRLFAIERLPANHKDDYPKPLRDMNRIAFWEMRPHSVIEYQLKRGHDRWDSKIQDVAADIKRVLLGLRDAGGVREGLVPSLAAPRAAANPGRTVLLAQVTDDLEGDREQVRRYLEQFNITVLPAGPLPQGGADFTRAFEEDLARADLFVQLLGPFNSRRAPDLPQGYARYQFEAAKRHATQREKFDCLLWRRPDLDPASLTHEDATLLGEPDTQATGLEAFKAEIVRWIEELNAPVRQGLNKSPDRDIHVFVNANREDIKLAKAVQKEFERNNCTAMLPLYDSQPNVIMDDLEDKIIWCDALALIYGEADARWISRQAMLYSKLKRKRDEPARVVLICRGPPQPKPEHGVAMPELRELDYTEGSGDDPIRKLLSELRQ
jgi:hypothetical protein